MSDQDLTRYTAAMHGVQSAVEFEIRSAQARRARHPETEPKHLRVGINAAMVTDAAVVSLLIEKGVFTMDEYQAKLADFAEMELASYSKRNNGARFA